MADKLRKLEDGLDRIFEENAALHTRLEEALKWRPYETAPKDGSRILLNCGNRGIHLVRWAEAQGVELWCVDDNKHGPFLLRGYNDEHIVGWLPLAVLTPAAPKEAPHD